MPHQVRSRVIDAAIALLGVLVAILLRATLDPWLENARPFVSVYWAIGVIAFTRGFLPATLTAFVGFIACDYLFATPRGTLFDGSLSYVRILIFTTAGAIF